MVDVAQLVSAPDCGSGGRGFESLYPPHSLGYGVIGNTTDFDSVVVGSSPAIPANKKRTFVGRQRCVF